MREPFDVEVSVTTTFGLAVLFPLLAGLTCGSWVICSRS